VNDARKGCSKISTDDQRADVHFLMQTAAQYRMAIKKGSKAESMLIAMVSIGLQRVQRTVVVLERYVNARTEQSYGVVTPRSWLLRMGLFMNCTYLFDRYDAMGCRLEGLWLAL
jgi:hypothetical protein